MKFFNASHHYAPVSPLSERYQNTNTSLFIKCTPSIPRKEQKEYIKWILNTHDCTTAPINNGRLPFHLLRLVLGTHVPPLERNSKTKLNLIGNLSSQCRMWIRTIGSRDYSLSPFAPFEWKKVLKLLSFWSWILNTWCSRKEHSSWMEVVSFPVCQCITLGLVDSLTLFPPPPQSENWEKKRKKEKEYSR